MKNTSRAIINYCERDLILSQGALAGQPFRLLPWQKRFINGAFSKDVTEACLTMGRGGGKTTLIAAIGLAHLEADGVREPAAEITITASTLAQGQILFDHVLRFLGTRTKDYKKKHTEQRMELRATDSTILRVVPASPGALHGAAPSLVIGDELAQWAPNKVLRMLAALRTGLGKIPNSRMLLLGTRDERSDSPFEQCIRFADYSAIYAAGKDDPIFHKRTWAKANPSLRGEGFGDLLEAYYRDAKKAKVNVDFLQAFKALRLNLGVPDTLYEYVLEVPAYERCIDNSAEITKDEYVLGVDLGTTAAMSAISAYTPRTGALDVRAFLPHEPALAQREINDGVQGLYQKMHRRKELYLSGKYVVSIAELLHKALELWGIPMSIVCDRWRIGELQEALSDVNFPATLLDTRGQGYKDGSEDVRLFRLAALNGRVKVKENLLLLSSINEARVISDPAGNVKLSKSSEGGRRSRGKDDALAAVILAVADGQRKKGRTTGSFYLGKAA